MSLRIFSNLFQKCNVIGASHNLKAIKQYRYLYNEKKHNLDLMESMISKNNNNSGSNNKFKESKTKLSFEEFKKSQLESFEEFKKSTSIQLLCNGDLEKIRKAYEHFSQSEYYQYLRSLIGGNPSRMI